MTVSTVTASSAARTDRRRDRPGASLALVLGAQLMVILDMTVVNVALPDIETGLRFSPAGLSWVLNAYALAFGGLLLIGGRAGDLLGRRRVFVAGIAVFTLASLAGGLATNPTWLIAARVVQGVGGAFASPAALALIVSAFAEGPSRNRAMALYAGIVSGGSSLGMVLGGVIVQWISWRWAFFINLPVGIAVIAAAPAVLRETPRSFGHYDLAGGLTSVLGMTALVYAFVRAAVSGWSDPLTLASLAGAVAALGAFVLIEARAAQPVTPLRLFASPGRSASYVARLLLVGGMFGMFFFITQFVQDVLGFTPLQAGLAFLPMTVLLFAVSRTAPRLLARYRPAPLMLVGMAPVLAGMAWLSQITPTTGYLSGVLGPMALFGIGMGIVFMPLTGVSLAGVSPGDAGAASGMVNVLQQVGGAVGLAILVTAFSTGTRHAAAHPGHGPHAVLVHGMADAFSVATIFDLGALLAIVVVAIAARRATHPQPAAPVTEPAAH